MATKIYCASIDCEYNGDNNVCMAREISMSDHYIMTLWEGRQHFNRCKVYKESDLMQQMNKLIGQTMKKMTEG